MEGEGGGGDEMTQQEDSAIGEEEEEEEEEEAVDGAMHQDEQVCDSSNDSMFWVINSTSMISNG